MKTTTIIWDFDGTLLPLRPYDSEQTLMRFKLVDRNGNERTKYKHKDYRFISSTPEIIDVLNLDRV